MTDIKFEETDINEVQSNFLGIYKVITNNKDPVNLPTYIGPTISKPKCYQF